ncbi:cbb3-type cytochrome oxidase assembly protein CcoS [Perlucidibaca aquatica]|uniref:cbb3-type cytochrome oxidase assembly protein CcoS n=1 Tax=Perlucidibaca aquatica TaxID=1852776 RepID=UPI00083B7675|nr:cbb3-type cytochrome oxidase assembly protein CcoS [Perlucidibaca aquatica]
MEVIYLLIPLSLLFLVASVWFFSWAVRNAQYDDLQGPAHRIILDDRDRQRTLTEAAKSSTEAGDTSP